MEETEAKSLFPFSFPISPRAPSTRVSNKIGDCAHVLEKIPLLMAVITVETAVEYPIV